MSAAPTFAPGQLLRRDDVAAAWSEMASRERLHRLMAHDVGPIYGLGLQLDEALQVQPGVAVDGFGFELVVSETLVVPASDLRRLDGERPVDALLVRRVETRGDGDIARTYLRLRVRDGANRPSSLAPAGVRVELAQASAAVRAAHQGGEWEVPIGAIRRRFGRWVVGDSERSGRRVARIVGGGGELELGRSGLLVRAVGGEAACSFGRTLRAATVEAGRLDLDGRLELRPTAAAPMPEFSLAAPGDDQTSQLRLQLGQREASWFDAEPLFVGAGFVRVSGALTLTTPGARR